MRVCRSSSSPDATAVVLTGLLPRSPWLKLAIWSRRGRQLRNWKNNDLSLLTHVDSCWLRGLRILFWILRKQMYGINVLFRWKPLKTTNMALAKEGHSLLEHHSPITENAPQNANYTASGFTTQYAQEDYETIMVRPSIRFYTTNWWNPDTVPSTSWRCWCQKDTFHDLYLYDTLIWNLPRDKIYCQTRETCASSMWLRNNAQGTGHWWKCLWARFLQVQGRNCPYVPGERTPR